MESLLIIIFVAAFIFFVLFPIIALVKLNKIANTVTEVEYRLNLLRADLLEKPPVAEPEPEKSAEPAPVSILETIPEPETKPEPVAAPVPLEVPAVVQASETPEIAEENPEPADLDVTPPAPEEKHQPGRLESILDEQAEKLNAKIASFEDRSAALFARIINWICVGEEYRTPGVSREYAVATTWLIRLGVIILLCGIGFFLKYSIDRNWTPPPVRVLMMTLAGLAMAFAGAWKSRGKYRPLAIAISGAGFVTLYLSITAAYKLYSLIPAVYAFIFMIIVTIGAIACAVGTNAMLTALLGCAGGYLTPVFISTGSNNIAALYIYMTVLGAGTLLAAFYRSWPLLNAASFIFYAIIGGAAITKLPPSQSLTVIGLLAANYLIFNVQHFMNAQKKDMTLLETLLYCGNAIFFFAVSLDLAQEFYKEYHLSALISLFAAAGSFAQVYLLMRKVEKPSKTLLIFAQLQLGFALILTVPLLLGNLWITAAWSLMAYAFVTAAIKVKSRTLLFIALALYLITPLREMVDSEAFTSHDIDYLDALLRHLLTAGVYIAALTAGGIKLIKAPAFDPAEPSVLTGTLSKVLIWAAGIIFAVYSSFEIYWAMEHAFDVFKYGVLVMYWSVAAVVMMKLIRKYDQLKFIMLPILLLLLAGVWSLAWGEPHSISLYFWKGLSYTIATTGVYITALALTARSFIQCAAGENLRYDKNLLRNLGIAFYSAAGILFFIYSSKEIYEFWDHYLTSFRNGGLSVYWSALAFALLVWGLMKDRKALRLCGIGLFVAAAVKIFFIDLANLEQLWRIVAFALIGIVMLIGAVVYIRCKDMFVKNGDDQE